MRQAYVTGSTSHWRAGTIRGQVTDEAGVPVPLAMISLSTAAGSDKVFVGTSTTANKNGEYSFASLPPGSYVVRATPVRTPTTMATYYPGVLNERDAAVVTLSAGDVVTGINIALLAQRSRQLRGHILGFAGVRPDVRLVRSPATLVRTATVRDDGAFSFGPLEDGRYIVTAVAESQGRLAGWQVVDLYEAMPGIEITLQPTGTLRGRIVTNRSDIALDRVYVGAALTDTTVDVDPLLPEKAEVDAEGWFEFSGMFGARTLRLLNLPAGCSLYDVRRRGTVVEPPHVTFTGNEIIDDVRVTLTCN